MGGFLCIFDLQNYCRAVKRVTAVESKNQAAIRRDSLHKRVQMRLTSEETHRIAVCCEVLDCEVSIIGVLELVVVNFDNYWWRYESISRRVGRLKCLAPLETLLVREETKFWSISTVCVNVKE